MYNLKTSALFYHVLVQEIFKKRKKDEKQRKRKIDL